MERLSERDRAVLNTIFEPLHPFELDRLPETEESDTAGQLEHESLEEGVLRAVKEAIACAESRNFEECFRLFQEALIKAPRSPSVLNDRAQALRLAGRDQEALRDLNMALEISGGKGKAGIQALCQRGALYKSMNEDCKAKDDFALAAKGGSSFAKSQLVALNPYAAMCNAMLQEIALKSAQRET